MWKESPVKMTPQKNMCFSAFQLIVVLLYEPQLNCFGSVWQLSSVSFPAAVFSVKADKLPTVQQHMDGLKRTGCRVQSPI